MTESMMKIQCITSEEGYFFEYEGKFFKVQPLLYNIFNLSQNGSSSQEISKYVSTEYSINISDVEVENIIKENTEKIFKRKEQSKSYINWRINLMSVTVVERIGRFFAFLFNYKYLIISVCFLMTIVNTYYLFNESLALNFTGNWILFYLLIFISGLIHEVGHSSASIHYKVKSDKIGFGFFIIFPVFYSDVTKIWTLNRHKRFIVNISGIYFQLIFVTLLIILSYVFRTIPNFDATLNKVIFINYFMIIISLNPYMRNDGYWVLSDYFEIPNLVAEARSHPIKLIKRQSNRFNKKQNILLFLYALGYYILVIGFVLYLIVSSVKEYQFFRNAISNSLMNLDYFISNSGFLIKMILKYVLIGTIIFNQIKKYGKR